MSATLTTASELAVKIFNSKMFTEMVHEHAGAKQFMTSRGRSYTTGNDTAVFASRLGYSGAKGTAAANQDIPGAQSGATYPANDYEKIETKIAAIRGYLKISSDLMPDNLGNATRNQIELFTDEVMAHMASLANMWSTTFYTGGSDAIFLISDTAPNQTGLTGKKWRVYVNQTASAAYLQDVNAILPGHRVEVCLASDHSTVAGSVTTNEYRGIIRSVASDGQSVVIEWDNTEAQTGGDLSSLHFVRFERPASSGLLGKYGLNEWCGNASSTYIDNAGASQNKWPYHTSETGIDPDTVGEWNSIIFEQAGSTFSVEDLDAANRRAKRRNGAALKQDYVWFGGPEIEEQLVQEHRLQRRYTDSAKGVDQTPGGRRVMDDGSEFYCDSFAPVQYVWKINVADLANDELDDRGPVLAGAPNEKGRSTGSIFTATQTTDEYYAHTRWYGQRVTLQRRNHVRIDPKTTGEA